LTEAEKQYSKCGWKEYKFSKMVICQAGSAAVNTCIEKRCDTTDETLEYIVYGDRLRDVIMQAKVWEHTI
jgi:hypothetical protein